MSCQTDHPRRAPTGDNGMNVDETAYASQNNMTQYHAGCCAAVDRLLDRSVDGNLSRTYDKHKQMLYVGALDQCGCRIGPGYSAH